MGCFQAKGPRSEIVFEASRNTSQSVLIHALEYFPDKGPLGHSIRQRAPLLGCMMANLDEG